MDVSHTIYTYTPPETPKSPKLPYSCKRNKYTTSASTYSTPLLKFFSFKKCGIMVMMEWVFLSVFISDINNIAHNFRDI